ncbi:MAG: sigma factor-like helix-turn-helix DNA-binding protein [bacterium]
MANNQKSILDKIISAKQSQEIADLNPVEIIINALKTLNAKERDIVTRRFGLLGKNRETLEEIGQSYQVTRERIRQIERGGIKKLKNLDSVHKPDSPVQKVEDLIARFLEDFGGAMSEDHLLDSILFNGGDHEQNRQGLLFILSELASNKLQRVSEDDYFEPGWRLDLVSEPLLKELADEMVKILEKENQPLAEDILIEKLLGHTPWQEKKQQLPIYGEVDAEMDQKIIYAFLNLVKKLQKNIFDEWGLNSWRTVAPKKINDKIYLILKQQNQPLHFSKISELINQANFDDKIAYPATVHNELILDPQYVLVGRGVYALAEWGYEPGTVSEVIANLLKKQGSLDKPAIIEIVLKKRLVSANTINLALTNRQRFKKLADGKYALME